MLLAAALFNVPCPVIAVTATDQTAFEKVLSVVSVEAVPLVGLELAILALRFRTAAAAAVAGAAAAVEEDEDEEEATAAASITRDSS